MAIHLRARLFLSRIEAALTVALVALVALFGAEGARACSVCFVAEEETRVAFLVTTGLLTLLPLAFAGGVVWWLVRRARSGALEHDAEPR